MPIRLAIVGPGRVGKALGRRLHEASVEVLGFLGRSAASVDEALRFVGVGRVLTVADLAEAHAVLFTVGDPNLEEAVATSLQAPPRSCSLWFHTSGQHGLDVLAPVAALGARIGALHPALPFASAEAGFVRVPGAPAVLQGDGHALPMLQRLCELLGMRPMVLQGGEAILYHAACALAANGATALFALVEHLFTVHGGLSAPDRRALATALMTTAAGECGELGAAGALSGPVLRGDAATVKAHLEVLHRRSPGAAPAYRALMQKALELAGERGLPPAGQSALGRLLADSGA